MQELAHTCWQETILASLSSCTRLHMGNLRSAKGGLFTPRKLADARHQGFLPPERDARHLQAPHWEEGSVHWNRRVVSLQKELRP